MLLKRFFPVAGVGAHFLLHLHRESKFPKYSPVIVQCAPKNANTKFLTLPAPEQAGIRGFVDALLYSTERANIISSARSDFPDSQKLANRKEVTRFHLSCYSRIGSLVVHFFLFSYVMLRF